MILDIHNHPDFHGCDFDAVLANMDQYGISKTCILSWECPPDEWDPGAATVVSPLYDCPAPLSLCLSYVQRAHERFLLGYCPDPRKSGALERMKAAVDLYHVRIYGEMKLRMMYDNPDALEIYRFCGERGIPVLMHLDYPRNTQPTRWPRHNWWYGGGIEALERALIACPETNFIGHAPGFWSHISGDMQYKDMSYPKGPVLPGGKLPAMLDRYPNLFCDISAGSGLNALSRDTGFAKGFLSAYAGRILYGRDCYNNTHQEFLNGLGVDREILDKIYYKNAIKLLGE